MGIHPLTGRGARACVRVLVVLAALFAPAAADASCDLSFVGPDAQSYAAMDFSQFVEKEIRPRLSTTPGSFSITVNMQCAQSAPVSVAITFDDTDYYITDIDAHHLTDQESTYRTSALALGRPQLEQELVEAGNLDSAQLADVQNAAKTLAFFFAESARFSDVEGISGSLMNQGCASQWLDYATLLRRWGRISRLALHEHNTQWTAKGGSSGTLIAPISADAIAGYNAAISAGHDGPDASYVDSRDWGTSITAPPASCGR